MSNEVGTPRYLSLVVLLKKVGAEAVHKELGDRMERVATTASSLEAKQDSVNAVRYMLMMPVQVPTAEGKAQRQEAEVPQDEAEHEESVAPPFNDPQPSGEDSMKLTGLMALCTKLQTQVLDLQKAKDAQAQEIAALKKRIQRLERKKMSRPTGLKRLRKVGMTRRVESSEDQESLGAPEDASKHGRSIEDINADVDVSLVNETQERQDDDLMFDTGVLDDVEMPIPQETQTQVLNIKGKGIMIEPKVRLKRKDQIDLDEQIARDIQAKLDAKLIEE
ncbi:hypothetical protein Tco_0643848 [Tanacetum coccineum]